MGIESMSLLIENSISATQVTRNSTNLFSFRFPFSVTTETVYSNSSFNWQSSWSANNSLISSLKIQSRKFNL